MEKNQLGNNKVVISALGLGAMPMSVSGRPPVAQAIETIHCALTLGITLIDTADSYCQDESEKHHNERLIGNALRQYDGDLSKVVVVTKGGFTRPNGAWIQNGNPDHLQQSIRGSFEALGGEKPIDLWLYHSPDPNYTLNQSLTPAKQAVAEGLIHSVGVSNFSVEQIKRARDVVEIVAVENQFNPWHRNPEFDGVLDYCEREGLIFFAWSPLGGIGGKRRTNHLEKLSVLAELAEEKGVSIYCIILAWLRSKSPVVVPIPGASKPSSIADSVRSIQVELSDEEIDRINRSARSAQFRQNKFVLGIKRRLKALFSRLYL